MSDDFKGDKSNRKIHAKQDQANTSIDDQSENEIGLLQNSPIVLGFRELPVDCPHNESSDLNFKNNYSKIEFSTDESNDLQFDKSEGEQLLFDHVLPSDCNIDQRFTADSNNQISSLKLFNPINRRVFVRNSSLSTIAEEKTLATLTDISSDMANKFADLEDQIEKVNSSVFIQSLLNEFQDKTLFLNEILHVFEPSSKGGNFSRNVPIRISSPLKHSNNSKNSPCSSLNSPLSLRSTSLASPNYFSPVRRNNSSEEDVFMTNVVSNEIKAFYEHSNSMLSYQNTPNRLMAKKVRFVRRLKNRIETKRGNRLIKAKEQNDQLLNLSSNQIRARKEALKSSKKVTNSSASSSTNSFYSRKNYNLKMKKFLSFNLESNNNESDQLFSITQTINFREENKNTGAKNYGFSLSPMSRQNLFRNESVNVVPKQDIEPVFF